MLTVQNNVRPGPPCSLVKLDEQGGTESCRMGEDSRAGYFSTQMLTLTLESLFPEAPAAKQGICIIAMYL